MSTTKKKLELDLSAFPSGSVTEYSTLVCLACVFDIFTNQLGFAPRTAYSEIRKYSATIAELTAPKAVRPFFDSDDKQAHCPYCNAVKRWHARLETIRIEGGKATDAARRALLKKLPQKDNQFQLIETKSDKRAIFFDWLDTLVRNLDLDEEGWLVEATRAYLARFEPKTNWSEVFAGLRAVRRSQRLTEGWEREGSRLFLAPPVYNEALIVQYLVSRSHVHGGQTMEGRLTLFELVRCLRYSGYLDTKEVSGADQSETLDAIIDKIAGGQGKVKLYHIVDRREFLDKVKSVYARYAA
jgi:predicted DCC family thiol-disulfide oxidoreductase YuxK